MSLFLAKRPQADQVTACTFRCIKPRCRAIRAKSADGELVPYFDSGERHRLQRRDANDSLWLRWLRNLINTFLLIDLR